MANQYIEPLKMAQWPSKTSIAFWSEIGRWLTAL